MTAFNARLFKRCEVIEELWQHQFGMTGFAVRENDDMNVAALRVVQGQGKGKLVSRDEVGGARGLQAVDNGLRLKFACEASFRQRRHQSTIWPKPERTCLRRTGLLQLLVRLAAEGNNCDMVIVAHNFNDDLGRVLGKVEAGEPPLALLR
jgi:hypothetical protein